MFSFHSIHIDLEYVEMFLQWNEMVGESKNYEWTIDWLTGRAHWQEDYVKVDEPNHFLFHNSVGNQPLVQN